MPETISLPSGTLIDAAAELYAVANFLTALWGHQDGGDGNIADRVSNPVSELLAEAFGDGWSEDGGVMMQAEARAKTIGAAWVRDLGVSGTTTDAPSGVHSVLTRSDAAPGFASQTRSS